MNCFATTSAELSRAEAEAPKSLYESLSGSDTLASVLVEHLREIKPGAAMAHQSTQPARADEARMQSPQIQPVAGPLFRASGSIQTEAKRSTPRLFERWSDGFRRLLGGR